MAALMTRRRGITHQRLAFAGGASPASASVGQLADLELGVVDQLVEDVLVIGRVAMRAGPLREAGDQRRASRGTCALATPSSSARSVYGGRVGPERRRAPHPGAEQVLGGSLGVVVHG